MLDILSSPLRGYIAQNLQFYLSKYIEGIQLEGLGLFGGDLVLNDLEIKRHVLMVSERAGNSRACTNRKIAVTIESLLCVCDTASDWRCK